MGERDPQTASSPSTPLDDVSEEFSSNAVRLSGREWLVSAAIVLAVLMLAPWIVQRMEPFEPSLDYRHPYAHSEDYWLYARYSRYASSRYPVAVIGDSVIWGHYVEPRGTLSHLLNQEAGESLFANLALDGIRQMALAGLVQYHCRDIADQGVILHLNPLWMSSPATDLHERDRPADSPRGVLPRLTKLLSGEEQDEQDSVSINHPRLVPQLFSRPYGYAPGLDEAAGVFIGRHVPYAAWVRHMRMVYYDNFGLQSWSLSNPYENPLRAITLELPAPESRPQGNPVPWFEGGIEEQDFPWVAMDRSYQWERFRLALDILQARGNRVFVLIGPMNVHLMTPQSSRKYRRLKGQMQAWLKAQAIPYYAPGPLASDLYADSSHPLKDGYAELARQLFEHEPFRHWLAEVVTREKWQDERES